MAAPPEPQHVGGADGGAGDDAVGRHRLGPHVVGQRVVVRRLLRGRVGPTGGPAFTDLLGTCLGWSAGPDGSCLVQPDDPTAEPVRISLADVVSGKPVPPRPSHRLRVDPLEAQTHALALFPDLVTEQVGRWVLRRSPTSAARRAGSVLAFGPAGVEDAYERVVAFYGVGDEVPTSSTSETRRPIAAVLPDSDEERLFRVHGWGPESADADTVFMVAGVAAVRRRLRGVDAGNVELAEEAPGLVRARVGDVATGVAAYDSDWVGLRGVEVDPAHRRQGLGLRVVAALVGWGAEQGATTAYLQVLGDNTAALALYERLGFAEHHRYRYLAPGR